MPLDHKTADLKDKPSLDTWWDVLFFITDRPNSGTSSEVRRRHFTTMTETRSTACRKRKARVTNLASEITARYRLFVLYFCFYFVSLLAMIMTSNILAFEYRNLLQQKRNAQFSFTWTINLSSCFTFVKTDRNLCEGVVTAVDFTFSRISSRCTDKNCPSANEPNCMT